jgi:hypothetical protein
MANFISEDQIEKAIIGVFLEQSSYRHVDCQYEDVTGRTGENEVVIKPILKQRLESLNQDLPQSAIEEAVDILCHTRMGLIDPRRGPLEFTGLAITTLKQRSAHPMAFHVVARFGKRFRGSTTPTPWRL